MKPSYETSGQGDIGLFLTDTARALEQSPAAVAVGLIRLGIWQVYPLSPVPADFGDHDAYLVRISYDLELAPGAPGPRWIDLTFTFMLSGATVLDAVPRSVETYQTARAYTLTPHLEFVSHTAEASKVWATGSPAASVVVPDIAPEIRLHGVPSPVVRWVHTAMRQAGVRPGAHSGWIVLVVPRGTRTVPVTASAHYDLAIDLPEGLGPATRSDAFTITLPNTTQPPAMDDPHGPGGAGPPARASRSSHPGGARVFVSYAHDNDDHKRDVLDFCEFLDARGLDVRMDQWELQERREWQMWTTTQILRADYITVIASPILQQAGDGLLSSDRHRGIQSELARLADLLHHDRTIWTRRILPVILPGRAVDEIPLMFLPRIADHYIVSALTEPGAEDLLRVLDTVPPRRPS